MILPGDITKVLLFSILGDLTPDSDVDIIFVTDSIIVNNSCVEIEPFSSQLVIIEDDISVEVQNTSNIEGDTLRFTVGLNIPPSFDTTSFDYRLVEQSATVAGGDLAEIFTGTLTILQGSDGTEFEIAIPTLDNTDLDGPKTFLLIFSNIENGTLLNDTAIGFILDDEGFEAQELIFCAQPIISIEGDAVQSVYAADFDGDGDIDVLAGSDRDDAVRWYENDGSGNFTTPDSSLISTAGDDVRSVYAADFDGDGDIDVLAGSFTDNAVRWYENDGSGIFSTPSSSVISTASNGVRSVYAADFDGDGDIDVLAGSSADDAVRWYENDGLGSFSEPSSSLISTAGDAVVSVYAADFDGDGDLDVLAGSFNDDEVRWYRNDLDVSDSFSTPSSSLISTAGNRVISVYATDFDGDGDIDVLVGSQFDDEVRWYRNDLDVSDSFSRLSSSLISRLNDGVRSVYAADLNGDGNSDVLAGANTSRSPSPSKSAA